MIRTRALLFLIAAALSVPAFAALTVSPASQTINLDDSAFISMTMDPAPILWTFSASAGTVLPVGCSFNVASCWATFTPPVDTLPGGQQKLRAGTYTITVTAMTGGSPFGQQTVTVIVREATVAILPFNPTVVDYEVRRIEAIIEGIGTHQLAWSVNGGGLLFNQNPSYADFRAVDPGTWTITIQSNHPQIPISASAQITIPPVTLNITPDNPTLYRDGLYSFESQLANTARPAVQWIVTNGSFVTNPAGPLAATIRAGPEIGTGTITAIFSPHNLTDTTTFQVVPAPKVTVTPAAITVVPGMTTRFLASVVGIADSRVTWSTNQPGGVVDAAGLFHASAQTGTFEVRATSVGNPAVFGSSAVTVASSLPPPVSVTINPPVAVMKPGDTQMFVFFAQGQNNTPHANQSATWSVEVPPGTPKILVNADGGVFTAPDHGGRYVITAQSDADPSQSAVAQVDVTKSVAITPASATLAPGASVQFNGTALGFGNPAVTWSMEETGSGVGTIVNGRYTAGLPGIVHIIAAAVADPAVRASATVRIVEDAAAHVEITPAAAQVDIGGSQQFTALVAGIANQKVTWSASAGSIQQDGTFTPPNRYGGVEIRATSIADPAVYGTASVLVAPPGAQNLEYDDNGNLVSDGLRRYFWDGENRLVRVEDGWPVNDFGQRVMTFTYDSEDRVRSMRETLDGNVVNEKTFLWMQTALVEERSASGAAVVRRFFGEGFQEAGVNYYIFQDHLGNIRDVTDADGNVRARYEYDPWGRRTFVEARAEDKSGAPRDKASAKGFNGFYHHDGLELDFALFRVYSADLGRWLSADPIGLLGGMNVYAFAANDPVNLTDALGLAPCYPKKPPRKKPDKDGGCHSVVCRPTKPPPKPGPPPDDTPPLPPIDWGDPWDPPFIPDDPCLKNPGGCFSAPLTPTQIWNRQQRNYERNREIRRYLEQLDRALQHWELFVGLFGAFGIRGIRHRDTIWGEVPTPQPQPTIPNTSSSGHR